MNTFNTYHRTAILWGQKMFFVLCLLLSATASADTIEVKKFRYLGPYPFQMPVIIDSLNVQSRGFSEQDVLYNSSAPAEGLWEGAEVLADSLLPVCRDSKALHYLMFEVSSHDNTSAQLSVKGLKRYQVEMNGQKNGGSLYLQPGTHRVMVRYMTEGGDTVYPKITVVPAGEKEVAVGWGEDRVYGMNELLHAYRCRGIKLSATGRYLTYCAYQTLPGGRTTEKFMLYDTRTGKKEVLPRQVNWMPQSDTFYYPEQTNHGIRLMKMNPATHETCILAEGIPDRSRFSMSPTEDFVIISSSQSGPSEDKDVYQVLNPEDRQPGWRNRGTLARYDLKTGILQPLVFGYHNFYLNDISQDGRYALISSSEYNFTKRPTALQSVYVVDMLNMKADTVLAHEGFLNTCSFSPDAKEILVTASAEAFNGIGANVKPGQTPNMYNYLLYTVNVATKEKRCLTRDFDPSIQNATWSVADGCIYFTAEDKDYLRLFRYAPKTGKFTVITDKEDVVNSFALARKGQNLAYYGQSVANSDRLYTMDLKSGRSNLIEDFSAETLKGVKLGECGDWTLKSSRGYDVSCRYYLPANFDSTKKYPMIVYYYGGCSPTRRQFEHTYPAHVYASQGYIFLVINPSGCSGFGQEWAARHVNTAGEGPAEDIIEATKAFVESHEFVNGKKIGCIGASYGGFMTQYLQTKTDLFAAAVSHAGISDHTSYWGNGYWGYSYSETSMANSYPWSERELYVGQSPLYNADKIHTPLLLIHGDADTNVPYSESVQMFTALKLLGREVALVGVNGENHHISDYSKRIKWQSAIFAWFAKYLKEDASWWNTMYPERNL